MSLSSYLSFLVQSGIIELGAAEIINRRFPDEKDQAEKVRHYVEGKKRLLADLEQRAGGRQAALAGVKLEPYVSYFNEEFAEKMVRRLHETAALLKKLETPCFLCGESVDNFLEHHECLRWWTAFYLSEILEEKEAAGEATPEDKANRTALEAMVREVGGKIDVLKRASASIPGATRSNGHK